MLGVEFRMTQNMRWTFYGAVLGVWGLLGMSPILRANEALYEAQHDWQQAMQAVASEVENSFFCFTRPLEPRRMGTLSHERYASHRSQYLLDQEPTFSLGIIMEKLPSESKNHFKASTFKYFSKILTDALNQNPKLSLVNRDEIDRILQEQAFQTEPVFDEQTIVNLGRLQGIRYFVFVSAEIDALFSDFFVKVVDVETAAELAPVCGRGIFDLRRYFMQWENYDLVYASFQPSSALSSDIDLPQLSTSTSKSQRKILNSKLELRTEGLASAFYDRASESFHGATGESQATHMTLYEMGPSLVRRGQDVTYGGDLRFGLFSYDDGYRRIEGFRGRWLLDSQGEGESQRIGVLRLEAPHLTRIFSDRLFLGAHVQGLEYEDDNVRDFSTQHLGSVGFSTRFYPSKRKNVSVGLDVGGTGLQDVRSATLRLRDHNALHVQAATCVATADETWVCELGARLEAIHLPDDSNALKHVREFVRLKRNLSRYPPASEFPDVWLTFDYEQDDWAHDQLDTPESQQAFSVHLLFEF